jgi:hypothetical protein
MPANERMDWLVEKATELGVASVQPLVSERSVLRLAGERAQKKQAHWQAIAIAACEQCGRNRVPAVHPVQSLAAWLATQQQPGLVLSLRGGAAPLPLADSGQQVTLLSGPEGGLTPTEEDAAVRARLAPGAAGCARAARRDGPARGAGGPDADGVQGVNRNLWLLAVLQGLFLTNNVTFIAINGLVGLSLAPYAWMATLPVMGYVVGSALCTGLVSRSQRRFGRQRAFQLGLLVALASALSCALAVGTGNFWLLCASTVVAGYYNANAALYRFASAELAAPALREKAVSLVMAGGLVGAVAGPRLAAGTRDWAAAPFAGAYVALAGVALLAMLLLAFMRFPPAAVVPHQRAGRSVAQLLREPAFLVAALAGASATAS